MNPSFQPPIPSPQVRERYHGCLLGGAVGDALGAPVEFLRRAEIEKHFGSTGIRDFVPAYGRLGAITDDTQMTLFTAEGVLRAHVRGAVRGICHTPSVIHHAYLRWLHTQGFHEPEDTAFLLSGWLIQQRELFAQRAPGTTCIQALRHGTVGKAARNQSKGCGGVMRVAPVGMYFHGLSQQRPEMVAEGYCQAFDLGCDAAALTHGHPTGYLTAGVMAALIFDLLNGSELPTAVERVIPLLSARDQHQETLAALNQALQLHERKLSTAEAISQLGEGWIAEEALAIGLYCALQADDLETGVIMAVNHDGDSDSTGLIAGHLLGAMQGLSAIPERWMAALELRQVLEAVADDLATAGSWQMDDWNDAASNVEADYYLQRYPTG